MNEELMKQMGLGGVLTQDSAPVPPVSNDQSLGGGQQVPETTAPPVVENSPPADQTQTPPVETPQDNGPDAQQEQTQGAQQENLDANTQQKAKAGENGSAQQESENEIDPNLMDLSDLGLSVSASNTTNPVPTVPQQPLSPPVPQFDYGQFGRELGVESIQDRNSLVDSYKALQAESKILKDLGIDRTVLDAVQNGVIAKEELLSGQLMFSYGEGLTDRDVVSDSIIEANPNINQKELEEALSEMDPYMMKSNASMYKNMKNMQRNQVMQQVQSKLQQNQLQKQRELQQVQMEQEQLRTDIAKSVQGIGQIAGTNFTPNEDQKQALLRVASNPELLNKALWGNGQPNVNFMLHQLSKLLFGPQISEGMASRERNDARKEIIQQTQNLDRQANTRSVGAAQVQDQGQAERNKLLDNLIPKF